MTVSKAAMAELRAFDSGLPDDRLDLDLVDDLLDAGLLGLDADEGFTSWGLWVTAEGQRALHK